MLKKFAFVKKYFLFLSNILHFLVLSKSSAKSQDRAGIYNLSQSFDAQYSSALDPDNLASRLTQQQHLNRWGHFVQCDLKKRQKV